AIQPPALRSASVRPFYVSSLFPRLLAMECNQSSDSLFAAASVATAYSSDTVGLAGFLASGRPGVLPRFCHAVTRPGHNYSPSATCVDVHLVEKEGRLQCRGLARALLFRFQVIMA